MEVHRISIDSQTDKKKNKKKSIIDDKQPTTSAHRPTDFGNFIGQENIKTKIQTAIQSARDNKHTLGHILLMGPSGYGKTTLAQITASVADVRCTILTAYALSKPADLLSLLPKLGENDILFIDEIHRIKPLMEEMLYTAMEDNHIDMILPDGTHLNIPLKPFTLIGATTQPHKLTAPLKNRFVYQFHLEPYTSPQVGLIASFHLEKLGISADTETIQQMIIKMDNVPRSIKNTCTTIRDRLTTTHHTHTLGITERKEFATRGNIHDQGLQDIHHRYLDLRKDDDRPLGLNTIAIKLNSDPQTIEHDIEPLLLKLGKIEKSSRGRIKIK